MIIHWRFLLFRFHSFHHVLDHLCTFGSGNLVRWSKLGKVDLNAIYNTSGIHQNVPTVHDEFNEPDAPGYNTIHKLYVTHDPVPGTSDFVVGKHEYLPFPRDAKTSNPNLHDVLGWAK